jgi:homoserine dehydrogenase
MNPLYSFSRVHGTAGFAKPLLDKHIMTVNKKLHAMDYTYLIARALPGQASPMFAARVEGEAL